MPRQRLRQSAAEDYLRMYRATFPLRPFPPIAACAREAGVSYVTMWKAFAAFREKGQEPVRVFHQPTLIPPSLRWQDIRTRIIRDIVSGRYSTGGSLTFKELVTQYGACYRTARTAILSLESRGWIVRDRKHFRIRSPVTGGLGRTVVLLSNVNRTRSVTGLSSRLQELIRATEIHCSRMRLNLEPVYLDKTKPQDAMELLEVPSGPGIIGYLVWLGDLEQGALEVLLERLTVTGKPISVLDEVGEVPSGIPGLTKTKTAFFSMANSRSAGRAMGRHLLGLGHTNVGFISLQQGERWADNRFEGLRETLHEAGHETAVHAFGARTSSPLAPFEPFLQTMFDEHEITAWVAVTDTLGLCCLSWLADRRTHQGRIISVAGFDDSPDAFLHNLTSYNFNCEATIYAMLAHLFGRRMHDKEPGRKSGMIEIEGFVTPRCSTKPVRYLGRF